MPISKKVKFLKETVKKDYDQPQRYMERETSTWTVPKEN